MLRITSPLRPLRRSAVAVTVASAAAPSSVTIQVAYSTDFGQVLKIVGGSDSFGDWNPENAPGKLTFITSKILINQKKTPLIFSLLFIHSFVQ